MRIISILVLSIFLYPATLFAGTCPGELVAHYSGKQKAPVDLYKRRSFWRMEIWNYEFFTNGLDPDTPLRELALYLDTDYTISMPTIDSGLRIKCVRIGNLVRKPDRRPSHESGHQFEKKDKFHKLELIVTIVEILVHLIK